MRQLNKNSDKLQNDNSIKQKVAESVNAKLEQQKKQIRNRLTNIPLKLDKNIKKEEIEVKKPNFVPTITIQKALDDISMDDQRNMDQIARSSNLFVEESNHKSKDESNLFETDIGGVRSYLNDNDSMSQFASDKKTGRNINKPQINKTTIHKVINSVDSFAVIEQNLKTNLHAMNPSRVDDHMPVPKNVSLVATEEPRLSRFRDKNDSRISYNRSMKLDSSYDRPIYQEDAENNISLNRSNEDMAVSLKNYLYDDMLGCYYDPVTKEYYAENS